MNFYTVTAVKSGKWWSLQCTEVPSATGQVARLDRAADTMREAIAAAAQVPEDSILIDLEPVLPPAVAKMVAASEDERHAAAEQAARAAAVARHAAALLRDENLTTREIGIVLGVSHQRVNQLLKAYERDQQLINNLSERHRQERSPETNASLKADIRSSRGIPNTYNTHSKSDLRSAMQEHESLVKKYLDD